MKALFEAGSSKSEISEVIIRKLQEKYNVCMVLLLVQMYSICKC